MLVDAENIQVEHNAPERRFEVKLGCDLAVAEYMQSDGVINFYHTEVPPAYQGQGIGEKIAQTALDYARAEGLRVVASCPFISVYIRRHKAYQDLLES